MRELLLSLGLDVNEQSFAKGALAAKGIEKALGVIVDVAKDVAKAFYENIKAAIEYGDGLDEAAQAVGVTTDALQELRYAASLSGIGAEELDGAMMKLARTMASAKEGSEAQQKAFSKLGIRVTDGAGKLRAADEVTGDLAEKFAAMPDGAEKTALSMEFFGRTGAKLIPFLNAGRDGLAELREEAHELGLVMGEDAIKASAELGDNLDRLKATTKGLWRTAVAPLLPALNDLVKRFLAWRKENAALIRQALEKYVKYIIAAFKVLGNTLLAMWNVGARIFGAMWSGLKRLGSLAIEVMDVFGKFKWVIFGAIAFALSPLLAIAGIISAITLLIDDYLTFKKHPKAKTLFGLWKQALDEWMKPAKDEPWFVKAIKEFVHFAKKAIEIIGEIPRGLSDAQEYFRLSRKMNFGLSVDKLNTEDLIKWDAILKRQGKREALLGFKNTEQGFFKPGMFAPSAPTVASPISRTASSVSAPVQMNIYQQPGESSEDFAVRVKTYVEQFWGVKMEEAAAGASR